MHFNKGDKINVVIVIIISQLAQVTVSILNFFVVAAIKEYFFWKWNREEFEGIEME